jgi:hypothetical protein
MRGGQPDPLGADIVHMRENRGYGAHVSGRLRRPYGRVKVFDQNLVHAIVDCKSLDSGSTELSVNLASTRGHRFLLLDA